MKSSHVTRAWWPPRRWRKPMRSMYTHSPGRSQFGSPLGIASPAAIGTSATSGWAILTALFIKVRALILSPYYFEFKIASAFDHIVHERPRRLLVIVNPFSGRKAARAVYNKTAYLYRLAKVEIDLMLTAGPTHASEIVTSYNLDTIQGIVVYGGNFFLPSSCVRISSLTFQRWRNTKWSNCGPRSSPGRQVGDYWSCALRFIFEFNHAMVFVLCCNWSFFPSVFLVLNDRAWSPSRYIVIQVVRTQLRAVFTEREIRVS